MADELDQTSERMEFDISVTIRNVLAKGTSFLPGQEGDCDLCGEHYARVIEVQYNEDIILACGRCRDRHGVS